LETIEGGITDSSQINTVLQEVILIKNHITDIEKSRVDNSRLILETIKVTRIEPDELTDPLGEKAINQHEKNCVLKKSFRQNKEDVACIPITIQNDDYDDSRIKAQLIILEKLPTF